MGYVFISPKMTLWSDWWCILGVSSQSFDVFTFNMLLLNEKSFFRSPKDLRLVYLWASVALEIWLVMYLYHQNWICGVTGGVFLWFPAKVLLYSFLIWYWWMEKQFSEVKNQTHLHMTFSSFKNMAGLIFISPKVSITKMNLCSDWWCFPYVSSLSTVLCLLVIVIDEWKIIF